MKRFLTISLILALMPFVASAFYSPWDSHHDIKKLCNQLDSVWIISNNTDTLHYDVANIEISCNDFTFTTRMRNLNNAHNKRYHFYDSNGRKHSVTHPAWGLVAIDDTGRSLITTIKTIVTSDWEYTSKDALEVTLSLNDSIIDSQRICYPKIEPFNLYNSISLKRVDHQFTLSIGSRYLHSIISAQIENFNITQIGYISHPATLLHIEQSQLLISQYPPSKLSTSWDYEAINRHLGESIDPIEGYWTTLDRSLDDNLLRIGGNYSFALIRDNNCYLLIYLSGASINPQAWQEGMIKAQLTPSRFNGNYEVTWWDAQMIPLSKDIIATIENNTLITIQFPYQSSFIRLHRVAQP